MSKMEKNGQNSVATSAQEIINEGVNLIVNELKGNDFVKKQIDRFGGCTIVGTQNTDPSINLSTVTKLYTPTV